MRLICILLLFCVTPFVVQAEDWDPSSTSGLIVGVLEWQKPGLDPFSNIHRKDRELYDVFMKRGVKSDRLGLLLDRQGTRARILEELRNRAKSAPGGSTFIFYYAGHGLQEGGKTSASMS